MLPFVFVVFMLLVLAVGGPQLTHYADELDKWDAASLLFGSFILWLSVLAAPLFYHDFVKSNKDDDLDPLDHGF